MKILSAEQQQQLDKKTMEKEPISSIDLMERAASRWTDELLKYLKVLDYINQSSRIGIFCGPGNNGGDGLVIARLLDDKGYDVTVCFVALSDKGSHEFEYNRKRLEGRKINWIDIDDDFQSSAEDLNFTISIDAIFGTGLSRPAEGLAKKAIDILNLRNSLVFSVDIPSGLYCNRPNDRNDAIVKAHMTWTFQAPKLSFFLPEQGHYVGDYSVIDIDLDQEELNSIKADHFLITKDELSQRKKKRSRFSHKGTYGHAGIIAGSASTMGAALLSSEAALRTGTGLVTAYIPETGRIALNSRIPSVMFSETGDHVCESIKSAEGVTYGVGPGIGRSQETVKALEQFIQDIVDPIVIDADALNIISQNKSILDQLPSKSILTPHPKEFERLFGTFENAYERMQLQKANAKKYDIYLVLKDAFTTIATPEGIIYINSFGNSGMATGGSGDVLTGIITGLLAQGYSAEDAAVLGVGIHGLSGDLCAEELGQEGMISEDLINYLSNAFKQL